MLTIAGGCHGPQREPAPTAAAVHAQGQCDELREATAARLVAQDPLAFLEACRSHYRVTIHDYRCLFLKQERVEGVLLPEERIKIRFREKPYSVDMEWVENARRASRLTYVEGRWTENGRHLAHIQPAGVLGLLVPMGVKRDIHGVDMARESRRPVDQFGYDQTLRLMIEVCRSAAGRPQYQLRYAGATVFRGRPCYHLERRLPYSVTDDTFPNRLLDIYIDREWLVPIGCLAYADEARTELLGRYLLVDAEFNVGLTDEDF